MKFNIGDIVEFNHLDETTRDYKSQSGILIEIEDNSIHKNYSACVILSDGKTIRVPACKLLKTKMESASA